MVAKKAVAVIECLVARLGTLVGPAYHDEVLLCCKDISAHVAAAPTMMAMSSDEEIVGELEDCRNVRLQSEMAARQFMVVTTQANECFKRVYETRTTFKPTHSDPLQYFDWLDPPLESAPGSLNGDEGDACDEEGEESSDDDGDSGEEGGDSSQGGGDIGEECGDRGGGDSGGNCPNGTNGTGATEGIASSKHFQPRRTRQEETTSVCDSTIQQRLLHGLGFVGLGKGTSLLR
jgi:uncharacterized membrane protein YgcG